MSSVNRTTSTQGSPAPAPSVREEQPFSVKGKPKPHANKPIGDKSRAPKSSSYMRKPHTDGAPGNGSEGIALPLENNELANRYGAQLSALAAPSIAAMPYPRVTYNGPNPNTVYFPISGKSVVGFWNGGQAQSFYPEGLQNPNLRLEFKQPDNSLVSPSYSGPMFAAPGQVQQNFNTRLEQAVQQARSPEHVWQPLASFPTVPPEMLANWQNQAAQMFPTYLPNRSSQDQPVGRHVMADCRGYVTKALQAFQNAQA
jgi:hypothetical protein